MLDKDEEGQVLPSIEDLAPNVQITLREDIILKKKIRITKRSQRELQQARLNG
jgi:hypothetical protein